MAAAGFLSRYLSGPLPYVLSASLNKTFPSFLVFVMTYLLPTSFPSTSPGSGAPSILLLTKPFYAVNILQLLTSVALKQHMKFTQVWSCF